MQKKDFYDDRYDDYDYYDEDDYNTLDDEDSEVEEYDEDVDELGEDNELDETGLFGEDSENDEDIKDNDDESNDFCSNDNVKTSEELSEHDNDEEMESLDNPEVDEPLVEELEAQMSKSKEGISRASYPFMSDEDFDFYMSNNENAIKYIKTAKNLTSEQRAWLENDFVERNLNLVYYIANKKIQSKFLVDVKELIGAGMLGFSKALNKYDPEQGAKFATFAYRCIDNEIKYGIRVESKHYVNTESADKPKYRDKDGKAVSLEDTIADTAYTPAEASSLSSRDLLIREKLNSLTPLEKYVMYTRFGLDKDVEMTQKEVALAVKMSQANISKIEKTCLDKLKEVMKDVN